MPQAGFSSCGNTGVGGGILPRVRGLLISMTQVKGQATLVVAAHRLSVLAVHRLWNLTLSGMSSALGDRLSSTVSPGKSFGTFFFLTLAFLLRARVILLEYLESLNTFQGKEEKGKMSDAVSFGLFSLLAFKALRVSSLLIFKMRLFGLMTPRLSALNT